MITFCSSIVSTRGLLREVEALCGDAVWVHDLPSIESIGPGVRDDFADIVSAHMDLYVEAVRAHGKQRVLASRALRTLIVVWTALTRPLSGRRRTVTSCKLCYASYASFGTSSASSSCACDQPAC